MAYYRRNFHIDLIKERLLKRCLKMPGLAQEKTLVWTAKNDGTGTTQVQNFFLWEFLECFSTF